MATVDLAIGRNRYAGLEVPEGCTAGGLRELLGRGGFKLLYPERLVFRGSSLGAALPDAAPLPRPPERVYVTGPHAVIKMLELALKDRLEAPLASGRAPKAVGASPPQLLRGGAAASGDGGALGYRALQVQAPAGVGPGSILEVEDPRTGQAFQVEVPQGAQAGGSFEVRLPGEPGAAGRSISSGSRAEAPVRGAPSAASVLAAPLDDATAEAVRARHPEFTGETPVEARYWSEADLERYCASGGQQWPCEVGERHDGRSCPLLRQLRLHLAERGVGEAPREYRALCRHLAESDFGRWCRLARDRQSGRVPLGLSQLPALAAPTDKVPRVARAPAALESPVVLEGGAFAATTAWDLEFWRQHYSDALAVCRARAPRFADEDGAEAVEVEARVGDYVDYARLLGEVDAECAAEEGVARFRIFLDGWPAFREALWGTFTTMWKELVPPGVEDLTVRWAQMFADRFGADWLETLARYYTVSIAAPGCISRLHRENNGAHLWVSQTDGRRLFFLFPPSESERLYTWEARGAGDFDAASCVSPVDVLSGASKRYPLLREARARVAMLERGETLVVPSGWWWYAVALEPCASVQHRFFNRSNFPHAARDLVATLEAVGDGTAALLEALRDEIADDNEDWGLTVRDE